MKTEFKNPETALECTQLYGKALQFAMKAHEGQTYDKGAPYVVHIIGVSNVGSRFGIRVDDPEIGIYKQCVCLLHDTIEDAKVKYRTLLAEFGYEIAEAVFAISDISPTRNREEANTLTWPKIRGNPIALHVKLCDRIFNMETSLANKSRQLQRYGNEYPGFRASLFNGEHVEMWSCLDNLYAQYKMTADEGKMSNV